MSTLQETICFEPKWIEESQRFYKLTARLAKELDGRFSAYLPALPGVVSEGHSEDAALANVRDALFQALATYHQESMEVPWTDPADRPKLEPGEIEKVILVDAKATDGNGS